MSNFNCLAPCCVPPPPPECCLTLAELAELFPNGLTVASTGVSIAIDNSLWKLSSSCCASVNIGPFGDMPLPAPAPFQEQCTSVWNYDASEEFRIKHMVRRWETIIDFASEPRPCTPTCPEPDLLEDFREDWIVEEKGELGFATRVELYSINITVGKSFQTCSYGTPACVYTVSVTFSYAYAAGMPQARRYYNKVTGTDILLRCSDGGYVRETLSDTDNFPICNYASVPISGFGMGQIAITRTKVLTTLTSPITLAASDPVPDWCDLPGACGNYTSEQTLEICLEPPYPTRPVYSARTKEARVVNLGCYFAYSYVDTLPEPFDQSRCYTVYANSSRPYEVELIVLPTPPEIPLDLEVTGGNPKQLVHCEILCSGDPFGTTANCSDDPLDVVLPFINAYLTNVGYLVDLISFSYVGFDTSLPICHNYTFPNWTLTF